MFKFCYLHIPIYLLPTYLSISKEYELSSIISPFGISRQDKGIATNAIPIPYKWETYFKILIILL